VVYCRTVSCGEKGCFIKIQAELVRVCIYPLLNELNISMYLHIIPNQILQMHLKYR
jgi:hypothetical protein